MGIGKNIKRYRHMAQLTQDRLALELGVARATIAQWEAETSTPKAERIFEIARTLGVPADQILEPARISYLIDEPGWTPEDVAEEVGVAPEPLEEPTPSPVSFTGPELKLLGIFRSLSAGGQRMLLTFAEDLDSSGAYGLGGARG